MVLFHIGLGTDNLDSCKGKYLSVEILFDFQFIRNVIRGITVNLVILLLSTVYEKLPSFFLFNITPFVDKRIVKFSVSI